MSQALVAHLILHPKISQSLKVLATTVGRDKVCQSASPCEAYFQLCQRKTEKADLGHSSCFLATGLSTGSICFPIDRLVYPPIRRTDGEGDGYAMGRPEIWFGQWEEE